MAIEKSRMTVRNSKREKEKDEGEREWDGGVQERGRKIWERVIKELGKEWKWGRHGKRD